MISLEVTGKVERSPGYIREKIDDYVIDELINLSSGARSDKIRELMYCAPVEFIFDTHVWDECLYRWLTMDRGTRDEWLEYTKEQRNEELQN